MEPQYSFFTRIVQFFQQGLTPSRSYVHVASTKRNIRLRCKRPDFIFFFAAIFSLSVIMSVFTSLRYIHIGNNTLYGSFLFFPLAFLCTDIINEIYGYYRVRLIIYATCIALMLMGALMALYLGLTQDASDKEFNAVMHNIPMLLVSYSMALMLADAANASIFHQIKNKMKGEALWFRSFMSTCIGHCIFSPILMVILIMFEVVDLPLNKIIDILCAGQMVKFLFSLTVIPLLYIVVHFVREIEKTFLLRMQEQVPHPDPEFSKMRVTQVPTSLYEGGCAVKEQPALIHK